MGGPRGTSAIRSAVFCPHAPEVRPKAPGFVIGKLRHAVKVTAKDPVGRPHLLSCAMIDRSIVGEVVGADLGGLRDLGALQAVPRLVGGALALARHPGRQYLQSCLLVVPTAAPVDEHGDPGRAMNSPDSAIGRVLALPAVAMSPLLGQIDLARIKGGRPLGERRHRHPGEARVDAPTTLRSWYALDAVQPDLARKPSSRGPAQEKG